MRLFFPHIVFAATVLLSCSLFVSCDKVNVNFGNTSQNSGNPNVTYYQNYKASLQTLQVDSFLTSGQQTFTIGYYRDPVFGTIHATSYAQLQLPVNPILNAINLSYDSLEVILRPKGSYYGDTTSKFYIRLYQLTEPIQNSILANTAFYNTRSFAHSSTLLNFNPTQYLIDSPAVATNKSIRISDALGQDLLNKFIAGSREISTQLDFENYFEGFYFDVDTSINHTNLINTFNAGTDSVIMRLHYSQHGLYTVAKFIDFPFIASTQFSHIDYNRSGTAIPAFPSTINNRALLNSSVTGNKAYINSSTGAYIKVSFPDILNLKNLHPFIKVLSAELVVPPAPGTYYYPYKLPPAIILYETDVNNNIISLAVNSNGASQNGNLLIDYLNGQSTEYTYDITGFITTLLNQGVSSTSALILSPNTSLGDQTLTRLVVNDQNSTDGIQLKLYVLGI
jgi:hypothetical protein